MCIIKISWENLRLSQDYSFMIRLVLLGIWPCESVSSLPLERSLGGRCSVNPIYFIQLCPGWMLYSLGFREKSPCFSSSLVPISSVFLVWSPPSLWLLLICLTSAPSVLLLTLFVPVVLNDSILWMDCALSNLCTFAHALSSACNGLPFPCQPGGERLLTLEEPLKYLICETFFFTPASCTHLCESFYHPPL